MDDCEHLERDWEECYPTSQEQTLVERVYVCLKCGETLDPGDYEYVEDRSED